MRYNLYSTCGCAQCKMAETILANRGIIFKVINLNDLSAEDRQQLLKGAQENGFMTMPIILDELGHYRDWKIIKE